MKKFICDSCLKEFGGPLDEVFYKDEHGENYVMDLCAPCRKDLKTKNEKSSHDFFSKIIKDKIK